MVIIITMIYYEVQRPRVNIAIPSISEYVTRTRDRVPSITEYRDKKRATVVRYWDFC